MTNQNLEINIIVAVQEAIKNLGDLRKRTEEMKAVLAEMQKRKPGEGIATSLKSIENALKGVGKSTEEYKQLLDSFDISYEEDSLKGLVVDNEQIKLTIQALRQAAAEMKQYQDARKEFFKAERDEQKAFLQDFLETEKAKRQAERDGATSQEERFEIAKRQATETKESYKQANDEYIEAVRVRRNLAAELSDTLLQR